MTSRDPRTAEGPPATVEEQPGASTSRLPRWRQSAHRGGADGRRRAGDRRSSLASALELPVDDVDAALDELEEEYAAAHRGFTLRSVGGGWRVYSRADYAPVVERFLLDGQQARLTQASLETLAVIAYRQPVSRGRVSAVRGVNVDGVDPHPAHPRPHRGARATAGEAAAILYGTTSYFLERHGSRQRSTSCPALAPLPARGRRPRRARRTGPRMTPPSGRKPGSGSGQGSGTGSGSRRRAGSRRHQAEPGRRQAASRRPRFAGSTKPSQPTRLPQRQQADPRSTSTTPTACGCRSCSPRPASGRDGSARTSSPPGPGGGRRPGRHRARRADRPGPPDRARRRHARAARRVAGLPRLQQAARRRLDDERRAGPGRPRRLRRQPQGAAVPRRPARRRHRGPAAAHQRRRPRPPAAAPVATACPRPTSRRSPARCRATSADGCARASSSRTARCRSTRSRSSTRQPGKAMVEVVLHEGRKHIVRRMLDAVGHPVETLVRVQVGPIRLGDLKSGQDAPPDPRPRSARSTPPPGCDDGERPRPGRRHRADRHQPGARPVPRWFDVALERPVADAARPGPRPRGRRARRRRRPTTPDLVVVAAPPDVAADVRRRRRCAGWPEAVVTDVASVKGAVLDAVARRRGRPHPLRRVAPDGRARALRGGGGAAATCSTGARWVVVPDRDEPAGRRRAGPRGGRSPSAPRSA